MNKYKKEFIILGVDLAKTEACQISMYLQINNYGVKNLI